MTVQKSFTLRLFSVLFVSLSLILLLSGVVIYAFARNAVGNEFVRLNQASLRQTAVTAGRSISDLRSFVELVSVNSRLISQIGRAHV